MLKKKHIYFYTPTYNHVGGALKIFDYIGHALAFGCRITICCPKAFRREMPLFQNEHFKEILIDNKVQFTHPLKIQINPGDLAFFSWPEDFRYIEKRMMIGARFSQVIHIVQGTRHANSEFTNGYALRLLSRPVFKNYDK